MAANSQPLYESLLQRHDLASAPKIRASAAVVPWRTNARGDIEVFWIRRAQTMPFMGGWYAFPGGGLSRRDAKATVIGAPGGTSPDGFSTPSPAPGGEDRQVLGPDLVPGLVACALRELFEETGLLVSESTASESATADQTRLDDLRQRLLAKEVDAAGLTTEAGSFDASRLEFAGRWLTPPFTAMAFDNRFFLVEWPSDQLIQPSMMGREVEFAEWLRPQEALDRWSAGELLAAPPILHILRVLAEDGPHDGLARLRDPKETHLGTMRRIEMRPGVVLMPLLTPTLPPATRTNAFLLGHGESVLIDPATPLPEEQDRLLAALDAAQQQGQKITAIWISHHHSDHVAAVERTRQHLGVPVLAHHDTAKALAARGIEVDGELVDEQRITLAGEPDLTVRALHTPGHARGHLCFYIESSRTLLAGDLVSTLSTIVIDPPDGDMDDYLRSLDRMLELDLHSMFPSHGPGTLTPTAKLQEFRDHRLQREAQVLALWQRGQRQPSEMVREIYRDVPEFLHPVAERQLLAHLDRLKKLGKA